MKMSKGVIMDNIFLKSIFTRGSKGDKGETGINIALPQYSVVGYDGETIPEGYVETTNPTSGGSVPAIDLLYRGEAVGHDAQEVVDYSANETRGSNFSSYLSYNNSIFTVLQDFTALIVPWTYNYLTASGTYSHGEIYVNNNLVKAWELEYKGAGYYRGIPFIQYFRTNDTMYGYTPSSAGFPQQNIKIYKLRDYDTADLLESLFEFYYEACHLSGYYNP